MKLNYKPAKRVQKKFGRHLHYSVKGIDCKVRVKVNTEIWFNMALPDNIQAFLGNNIHNDT